MAEKQIFANISNRHVHVSEKDLAILFGEGKQLTNIKNIGQPGQYACLETVTIATVRNKMEKVRIIGPVRKQTQVEISLTDSYHLGIKPPIRESGDLAGSAPITITGPAGKIELKEGCIIMQRHIHFTPEDAKDFNITNGKIVYVRAGKGGGREVILGDVVCRVREDMALECHIDTDEANAAGIKNNTPVEIVKIKL